MDGIRCWWVILATLLVSLAVEPPVHAQRVWTNAYVLFLDGPHPDEASGPGATASSQSHYSGQGGEASASSVAVPQSLSAVASSNNLGLTFKTSGDAGFAESFWLRGSLPETSQPITLQLSVSVSLQCVTGLDSASVASVLVAYDFYSAAGRRRGVGQIGCQAGLPVLSDFSGGFEDGDLTTTATSSATLTPTIEFGGVIEELTGADLDFLGLLGLDFKVPLDRLATEVSILAGLLAEALNTLGLPRLGIPPGLGLDVGFAIAYGLRGDVSVPLNVSPNGFLNGFVNAIASSTALDAQGSSSVTGTVQAATIPDDIPDPESLDLELEFESGRRLRVYLASTLILTDGFETGDTSAWSVTVP